MNDGQNDISRTRVYAAPAIESIDLCTEAGFAQSSAGIVEDLDETDYGTY